MPSSSKLLRSLTVALFLPLLACDRSDEAPAAEAFEALLREPPQLDERCKGWSAPRISKRVSLRLFLGPDVNVQRARAALGSLPAYLKAHGIETSLASPPRRTRHSRLLGEGNVQEALAPLQGFLAEHAKPTKKSEFTLNVVLLSKIAAADSPAARYFEKLEGLSISPHRRNRDADLHRLLKLPEHFIPTMLLGVEDILHRHPGRVDLTAAHEFGHAMGLRHRKGENLMSARPLRCVPALEAAQAKALRRAFGN